ncbi:ABC transporter ATP-binding protein [Lapillicoccus sp.]|uniref:ABC transporter ATP-binding protein n=1 Tax=Lapillicoccus sp. TaxID=1909287 RepID=UPI003262D909
MTVPAISTRGLGKRYGRVEVLRELDLDVRPGEVFGYLGPNGSGKSTTIRLLLALARPSAGRAEIFGYDCQRDSVEVHRRLAYVPGEASLWPSLTGMETLHLLGRVHGSLDCVYRDELIERFRLDPSKKVRAYSKGNRQKVLLIAALMTRAELLIFDEPTSGLDPLMEEVFRQCVREAQLGGQTVFLSSHILSEAEALCDRVGILRDGQLAEVGTIASMRHLARSSVDITFDGAPPTELAHVPGVARVLTDGRRVHIEVDGQVQPLIDALAATGVRTIVSREASLEEMFLTHYGTTGSHDSPTGEPRPPGRSTAGTRP